MKKTILVVSVLLIIYFVVFDDRKPSCHNLGRKGMIQWQHYIDFRNIGQYDANNMEISLKNIRTLEVDKRTGKRTCVGQIIVLDKQNADILQTSEIMFSVEWSEQDNKFNYRLYNIK
jgi:hypothetical protein